MGEEQVPVSENGLLTALLVLETGGVKGKPGARLRPVNYRGLNGSTSCYDYIF